MAFDDRSSFEALFIKVVRPLSTTPNINMMKIPMKTTIDNTTSVQRKFRLPTLIQNIATLNYRHRWYVLVSFNEMINHEKILVILKL